MNPGFIEVLLSFFACYFIGSIPFAYIIVKLKHDIDITQEGSGNVGMLNSITVTKSKTIGIVVLFLDILKGAVPVYLMLFVFKLEYWNIMAASSCLVLGHNYPVWLKFKGGRGLATGTGIFVVLNYYVLTAWCIVWVISFLIKKKVLISNIAATILIPLYVLIINIADIFVVSWGIKSFSLFYFSLFSVVITAIVISRHTEIFIKNKK